MKISMYVIVQKSKNLKIITIKNVLFYFYYTANSPFYQLVSQK